MDGPQLPLATGDPELDIAALETELARVARPMLENVRGWAWARRATLMVPPPPQGTAGLLDKLGRAYYWRRRGDHGDNLEYALGALLAAVSLASPDNEPVDWAATKSMVSTVFNERVEGSPEDNAQHAVTELEEALGVLDPALHAEQWATATANLARVHHQRHNAAIAIELFRRVLDVRRRGTDPVKRSLVLLDLANTFATRGAPTSRRPCYSCARQRPFAHATATRYCGPMP